MSDNVKQCEASGDGKRVHPTGCAKCAGPAPACELCDKCERSEATPPVAYSFPEYPEHPSYAIARPREPRPEHPNFDYDQFSDIVEVKVTKRLPKGVTLVTDFCSYGQRGEFMAQAVFEGRDLILRGQKVSLGVADLDDDLSDTACNRFLDRINSALMARGARGGG